MSWKSSSTWVLNLKIIAISSFLMLNIPEDFLVVRPSGNPISAKGQMGMFDSKDLVTESSELI